jgi:type IV pilus assembly protein PilO
MQIIETLERTPDWQKYVIVGVAILIIIVAFYHMSYKPRKERIELLERRIADLEIKINKGLTMKGKLDQFRKEVYVLREQMRQAAEILGNKPAVDDLVQTMESLASQVGLTPIRFDPQQERIHQFYGEIPIAIEVSGGYHELGFFFEKIGNEPRIMNVTNLLVRGAKNRASHTVNGTFALTAFWFVEGEKR